MWWFLFFLWHKSASGQEGHWCYLKEVSELYMLVDSCLIGMTHLLIRFGGKQNKTALLKGCAVLVTWKAYLILSLHNVVIVDNERKLFWKEIFASVNYVFRFDLKICFIECFEAVGCVHNFLQSILDQKQWKICVTKI